MKQSIEINGKSLQQIADETGISYNTLYVRWKRNGQKLDEIKPKQNYELKDEKIITPDILEIIKEKNLNYNVVYKRLQFGWDKEKALNTPVNKNQEIKDAAEKYNIDYKNLLNKVKKGLTLDKAVKQILQNKNRKNLKSMDLKEIYKLNKIKKETEND